MKGQENPAELAIMSAVMVVLSILGIIAGFSRGLFGGIDGLLMLAIALMMLLIFALLLLVQMKEMGKHKDDGGASAPPAAK
jgi:ABC-type dipeptide/oligopeptide/nickel transport system permease subunit